MSLIPSHATGNAHKIVLIDRSTGETIGKPIQSFASVNFTYNQAIVEQKGGIGNAVVRSTAGEITTEFTLALGDRQAEFLEYAGIKFSKDTYTNGAVLDAKNKNGSSIISNTAGLSIGLLSGSESNLAGGSYFIKATAAKKFTIHAYNLKQRSDLTYSDVDTYQVGAEVDMTSGSTASVAGLGLQFTKNGTLAFEIGDTATFSVAEAGTANRSKAEYASSQGVIKAFALRVFGEIVADTGEGFSELYLPNCKVASDSIVMGKTGEFQDTELAISLTYDINEDCIAEFVGNFKA
tara:strand:- start:523 stop:1401 length:879 start_codon:yes stop_codon:yes gene_type:complete